MALEALTAAEDLRLRDAREALRSAPCAQFGSRAERLESGWPASGIAPVRPEATARAREPPQPRGWWRACSCLSFSRATRV